MSGNTACYGEQDSDRQEAVARSMTRRVPNLTGWNCVTFRLRLPMKSMILFAAFSMIALTAPAQVALSDSEIRSAIESGRGAKAKNIWGDIEKQRTVKLNRPGFGDYRWQEGNVSVGSRSNRAYRLRRGATPSGAYRGRCEAMAEHGSDPCASRC